MTKKVSIPIPQYRIPMSGSMSQRHPDAQGQRIRADRVLPALTAPAPVRVRVPAPVRAAAEQAVLRRISIGPD